MAVGNCSTVQANHGFIRVHAQERASVQQGHSLLLFPLLRTRPPAVFDLAVGQTQTTNPELNSLLKGGQPGISFETFGCFRSPVFRSLFPFGPICNFRRQHETTAALSPTSAK